MVLWVFGYGSLVWNPGFEFDEAILGYIKDHSRVFNLACIDHRGTPEEPARTLTLEAKKGAMCWDTAYCVRGDEARETMAMEFLRKRECEYDLESYVDFYKEGDDDAMPAVTGVLMFTSTPCSVVNKYYLGPAPLEEMARQIASASGPCGNNKDYLFKLEKALSDIDSVVQLANEVRKVLSILRLKEEKIIGARIALKTHLSPVPQITPSDATTVINSN